MLNNHRDANSEDQSWQIHPKLGKHRGDAGQKARNYFYKMKHQANMSKPEKSGEVNPNLLLTHNAKSSIVLDSGATHHMTNKIQNFVKCQDVKIRILTGDKRSNLHSMAIGKIYLLVYGGLKVKLNDVLLLPKIY